ncbi:MAG: T9SS type A sorting domain-containing protein [Bacteroidetes bacterium]|nr:T9SS type A sorting domain-containing protein [Bacteroidota bacterium]
MTAIKSVFFLFCLLFSITSYSQCSSSGGTNGGTLTPTSGFQTVTSVAAGKYYVVNADPCKIYTFSFCQGGGSASFDTQITITDLTGTAISGAYNDDYCSTQSELTWQPTSSGYVRVMITQYSCQNTGGTGATLAYKAVSSATNTAEYTILGSSVVSGSCTTITPNTTNQVGCVWDVNSTLNFNASFSYDFMVNLGSSDAGADGMAFVIQNDSRGRCACGTAGGAMGAGGINNSLVIEIDTYLNTEDRDDFNTNFIGCSGTEDPDHLDMWLNGNINPDLDGNCNTTSAGERPVTATAVRLQNPPGTDYNIENGANHIFRVSWATGSPGTLTARVLNAAATTTYGVISTTLTPLTTFGTNTPFFGFTGSTGGLANQQSFCNPAILLPVELTYFKSECNSNGIDVSWSTATEHNNQHFDLQRSEDGITFITIAQVPGHGTCSGPHSYSYSDRQAASGTTYYYRLKQVDFSGQSVLFNMIVTQNKLCIFHEEELTLYPNPAQDELFVKYSSGDAPVFEIMNDCGQLVYTSTGHSSGPGKLVIPTTTFATGIYVLRVVNGFKVLSRKFVVQHP